MASVAEQRGDGHDRGQRRDDGVDGGQRTLPASETPTDNGQFTVTLAGGKMAAPAASR